MSSFRIDRQYVSFDLIETQHVYTAKQASDAEEKEYSFISGKNGKGMDNVNTVCSQLIEKARKEAEENARLIIAGAEKEAEGIRKSAKEQAQGIAVEAESAAEKIKQCARTEGYAQVKEQAESEAKDRKNKDKEELQRIVKKLKSDYSGLVDAAREDMIAMIMEITKKIINVKLKESDQVFINLVNEALERLKQAGSLIIRVSPEDYARYFETDSADKNFNTGESKVVVVEEDKFSSGDLVVESEGEMLDLSINKQIEKVEKAFSEERS
jgi:Flagellar biosynthesis/type III secretory pathway protein